MPTQRHKATKSVAAIASICLPFMVSTIQAQIPKANPPTQSAVMETNIVDQAMALFRQRKFAEAKEILMPAADKGQPEPQALLGQMYNAGWGTPVDYEQAFKWWSRAADGGSADALWGLGLLYDDGKGVAQDSKKAAQLWKKATEKGNIKATVNLAFAYEQGRGVELDHKESAKLFKQAAEAGEPFAQVKFGFKLLSGEGVEKDAALAWAWIATAVDSPRIKGSRSEDGFQRQRQMVWADLSMNERDRAKKLKKEIQSHLKPE